MSNGMSNREKISLLKDELKRLEYEEEIRLNSRMHEVRQDEKTKELIQRCYGLLVYIKNLKFDCRGAIEEFNLMHQILTDYDYKNTIKIKPVSMGWDESCRLSQDNAKKLKYIEDEIEAIRTAIFDLGLNCEKFYYLMHNVRSA